MPTTTISNRNLPENYIYISHLKGILPDNKDPYFILPITPKSITDTMESNFSSQSSLSRSAPVYTYSNSGPRSIQVNLELHRDLMFDVNVNVSNYGLGDNEDYVDGLIRCLQAIALPKYNLNNKLVEPPLVALRISNEIFIKGIVNGGVSVTYSGPLLYPNNKYAVVNVTFTISETDPYDASSVFKNGSFRGMTRTLASGMGGEKL